MAHTSWEAVKKPSSWISATLAFENLSIRRLHAIYEAPRYILLHRQNRRLGIFTASGCLWEFCFRRTQFLSVDRVDCDGKKQTLTRNPDAWGTLIS